MVGTSWGVAIANDPKRRNERKWARIRQQHAYGGKGQRGLTGDALERAVMGVAQMFPGNVIREGAAA